jgi:hypothetical protein
MNRPNVRLWSGFAGGVLAVAVVISVMAAMGAGTAATSPTPRYSTQAVVLPGMIGSWLLVVNDNQTNKQYTYGMEKQATEFNLLLALDLSQTGNSVMKGEATEKPAKSPSKTPAK